MKVILLVFLSVVAAVSADCDACIDGWCHTKKTLIRQFEVPNQIAIDRLNNILYVQVASMEDPIFLGDSPKIEVVQIENLTAITVDQSTQVLYAADTQHKLYEYELGIAVESNVTLPLEVKKMLFHNDDLYYLSKIWNDYYVMLYARIPLWYDIEDYLITDFVVDKNENVYFVANDTVYVMHQFNLGRPKAVTCGMKKFALSTDKFGDVYIADETLNTIYKINNETDKLVPYAAYRTGSVNQFVFDGSNDIVFHDSDEETVNIWKSKSTRCHIGKPRAVYDINETSDKVVLPAAASQ